MNNTLGEFLRDYSSFKNIIHEYNTSFQYCIGQMTLKENADRQALLGKLDSIDSSNRQQKALLNQRVQNQLCEFRRLLGMVDAQERRISERPYKLFKEDRIYDDYSFLGQDEQRHSQQDINQQVGRAIQSIQAITKSWMPDSLVAICDFFNPEFRKDAYRRIVEDRKRLELMLTAAERDLRIALDSLKNEVDQDTTQKIAELQAEKQQLEYTRKSEKDAFFKELKGLLLDGLEQVFNNGSTYGSAQEYISNYFSTYTSLDNQDQHSLNGFMLGIVNQAVVVQDDGTLDRFLSSILQNGIYSNGSLLLPVMLERYLGKAICVNYYSQYNESIYTLFSNYAVQMMNLFSDVGVTTYLVDCTNMGSRYSEFTAFENDNEKRIVIIRTVEELKELIDDLSADIIETNSTYLRSDFSNVSDYNAVSVIKREVSLLFISSISEIASMDLLEKITSIARNGSRCGVLTFIGISTDECQISGLTSQNRVTAVNQLLELSDKICMSSNGELSFGNGLPQFVAPPEISIQIKQKIMMSVIINKSSIVPVAEHLPKREDFFSYTCDENVIIPIGIDAQGNEYSLDLNKEAAYMLIGGNPSSGKSSLVHTIILECITRYSPDDLELYVADLKDGSEFDIYVEKGIKSVKVALDDSESDIAASFLNYIKATAETRLEKFGELSKLSGQIVKNIEQFYAINSTRHLVPHIPRTLLIIDEFQSLYDASYDTGSITNWLVRMCRTVGIYIIMASQRVLAGDNSRSNSFGSQTKEYFIYRAMFKMPYASARQIMSEQCSDTGNENPAIRKAQTLKSGQMIINPNMGATEEDNLLLQCYYPDNETISSVCEQVIDAQGRGSGIILNSESFVSSSLPINYPDGIVLGESNRLYYDDCSKNTDDFIDNRVVALRKSVNKLLVCGNDTRVHCSVLLSLAAYLSEGYTQRFVINILSSETNLNKLGVDESFQKIVHLVTSLDEFLAYSNEQMNNGQFVLSAIINPYEYEGLHKNDYSDATDSVKQFIMLQKTHSAFTLVLCENIKKLKDTCSYIDQEIPCRIISIGNLSGIRAAMTMDAGEKLVDSPFNTVRPNVIKAYYYNKMTDKLGRFRLLPQERILSTLDLKRLKASATDKPVVSYAGLTGN